MSTYFRDIPLAACARAWASNSSRMSTVAFTIIIVPRISPRPTTWRRAFLSTAGTAARRYHRTAFAAPCASPRPGQWARAASSSTMSPRAPDRRPTAGSPRPPSAPSTPPPDTPQRLDALTRRPVARGCGSLPRRAHDHGRATPSASRGGGLTDCPRSRDRDRRNAAQHHRRDRRCRPARLPCRLAGRRARRRARHAVRPKASACRSSRLEQAGAPSRTRSDARPRAWPSDTLAALERHRFRAAASGPWPPSHGGRAVRPRARQVNRPGVLEPEGAVVASGRRNIYCRTPLGFACTSQISHKLNSKSRKASLSYSGCAAVLICRAISCRFCVT